MKVCLWKYQQIISTNCQQEAERNLSEAQELKEIRTKYWKIEKELNNLKIDKRILERELKESEAQSKELSKEIENMKEEKEKSKKLYKEAMLEMNSINDTLSMELGKLQERYKGLQVELEVQKKLNDETKDIVVELKGISNSKDEKLKQFSMELEKTSKDNRRISMEKDDLMRKFNECEKTKNELYKEIDALKEKNKTLNIVSKKIHFLLEF